MNHIDNFVCLVFFLTKVLTKWFIFKLFSFQIPQRMKSIVFVCFIMKLRINWESSTVIQVQYANPTTKSPALFLFLFCGWYYFEFKDFRSSLFSLNSSCVCPEATKPQESSFFSSYGLSAQLCVTSLSIFVTSELSDLQDAVYTLNTNSQPTLQRQNLFWFCKWYFIHCTVVPWDRNLVCDVNTVVTQNTCQITFPQLKCS